MEGELEPLESKMKDLEGLTKYLNDEIKHLEDLVFGLRRENFAGSNLPPLNLMEKLPKNGEKYDIGLVDASPPPGKFLEIESKWPKTILFIAWYSRV